MPASLALVSLLAAATPQAVTTLRPIQFPAPVHLVLDRRHYALPAGTVELRSDGHYYILPTIAMADCARTSGAMQVATPYALRWAGGLRTVYLASESPVALRYAGGEWLLEATSATGDVACGGEVMPTGVVFRSDFE